MIPPKYCIGNEVSFKMNDNEIKGTITDRVSTRRAGNPNWRYTIKTRISSGLFTTRNTYDVPEESITCEHDQDSAYVSWFRAEVEDVISNYGKTYSPEPQPDPTTARLTELNRTLELLGEEPVYANRASNSEPHQDERTRNAVLFAIESLLVPTISAPCDESDPTE